MVISQRIVTDSGRDEIAGDQFRPLMNQLIEGMLSIRPGFAPNHRAGLIVHFPPAPVNGLSIALHIPLLKVGWEAMQVLVIGQNGLCLGTKKVVVPNSDEGKYDGYVFLQSRLSEMDVHGVRTLKNFNKMLKSNRAGDGKSYR
jgi:hypothetical protein